MTPPFIFSLIILIVSPLSMLLAREGDDFISGRVTDDVGTGVPYANIYLKNGNRGTSSDRDGRFYLAAAGISDSTVIIAHSAFDTDTLNLRTVDESRIEIELKRRTYRKRYNKKLSRRTYRNNKIYRRKKTIGRKR